MTRIVIDLDEKALAGATAVLGTKTEADTVNSALRQIAAQGERVTALRKLVAAADVYGAPGEREGAWGLNAPAGCGP